MPTVLRLERQAAKPGAEDAAIGYTLDEMANIVVGTLRAIGLTQAFSPLVVITGHGSGSLNNPHASAYDCGACGGGRGGPNARAFAQMANDPRVRSLMYERGLYLPDSVVFLGAFHNTCDDSVTYSDIDRLPTSHRAVFDRARRSIDAARRRNAHERCRRFVSAPLSLTFDGALRHVENRAADLSQTRPELGHATNALCLVGRREWSRGLFLDRRAFLTSYDSRIDDERSSILASILRAVIPVCAGISLEYLFSRVDSRGYGCGTKLPHNVACMLGVMDGAASDLRSGRVEQVPQHLPANRRIAGHQPLDRPCRGRLDGRHPRSISRSGPGRIGMMRRRAAAAHAAAGPPSVEAWVTTSGGRLTEFDSQPSTMLTCGPCAWTCTVAPCV